MGEFILLQFLIGVHWLTCSFCPFQVFPFLKLGEVEKVLAEELKLEFENNFPSMAVFANVAFACVQYQVRN